MAIRKVLQESGTLKKGSTDGTYRVCIITEGTGSTGVYSREMLMREKNAFEGALSFMNHPKDPDRPQDRQLESLAGRLEGPVDGEMHEGVFGLWSDFRPNTTDPKRAAFIAEYADALGVSVFIGASGEEDDEGRLVVESLDAGDPYKSVDVVIAAGRGGRFQRAAESLRILESQQAINPPVISAGNKKEGHMDPETKEAFAALSKILEPVIAFVTESKAADAAAKLAEADTSTVDEKVAAAVTAFGEKSALVDAEKDLSPSQVADIKAAALKGEDVAPLIEAAKKTATEFKTIFEGAGRTISGHVLEGADTYDLAVSGGTY